MEYLVNDILKIFKCRTDKVIGFARGKDMVFRLRMPSREIPRYLLRHLKGHQRIGLFNFLPDGTCYWSVIEFEKGENEFINLDSAMTVKKSLREAGLNAYLERTQADKSFRVWTFFDRAVDSSNVRKAFALMLDKLGLAEHGKIYPTEDSLNGSENTTGEYCWMPFFGGTDNVGKGVRQEHTLFLDDEGETIPVDMTLKVLKANDPGMLSGLVNNFSGNYVKREIKSLEIEEKVEEIIEEKPVYRDEPEKESETKLEISMLDNVIDNMLLWLTSETFSPIPTGFDSLDKSLNGGIHPGKLFEIKGGSAVERVNFSCQIMDQIAYTNLHKELPVVFLYVSRRFSREELLMKSICRVGEFDEDYLESRRWNGEDKSNDFIVNIRDIIKLYQDVSKWIMILRDTNKIKVAELENTLRQLSYKFNTPFLILFVEDPFLVLENSSDKNKLDPLVELHNLAQKMNISVIALNEAPPIPMSDGLVHMSLNLKTTSKTINGSIKNKKHPAVEKLETLKEQLNSGEKLALLTVTREKTAMMELVPFIIKKMCNQYVEG